MNSVHYRKNNKHVGGNFIFICYMKIREQGGKLFKNIRNIKSPTLADFEDLATPTRTRSISGLKSRVLKLIFLT